MTGPVGGWNIFDAVREQPPVPQVYRSNTGTGFPSASRELARLPRNTNDANGYYDLIGVHPWCSDAELKSAIRRKMASLHPDHPHNRDADPKRLAELQKMFARIQEIADILLNPILRANYNRLPPGRKIVDSEVKEEMRAKGLMDDPTAMDFASEVDQSPRNNKSGDAANAKQEPTVRPEKYFDFLATGRHAEMDLITANGWYVALLDVAPMFHFTATIKVLLHDGKHSAVKKMGNILMIPRTWEPSKELAFSIFERHFGWPKFREPVADEVDPEWTPRKGAPGPFTGTGINGGGGHLVRSQGFLSNVPHVSVSGATVDPGRS